MPIYEYQCAKCAKISEVLQKISDKPLSKCPSCGGKTKRMMSRNSFQLKGNGWYVTDYKDKASNSTEGASSAPAAHEAAPAE